MKVPLRRLIRGQADDFLTQLFRYTLIGGVAYLFDFASLFALTDVLGVNYLISAAAGFVVGLTVNYLLCVLWIFKSRPDKSGRMEFAAFAAIGIAGLGLTEILMWVFTDLLGLHYLGSKAITTAFVFYWNFLVRRYTLFK